jgi:hypothetical protein
MTLDEKIKYIYPQITSKDFTMGGTIRLQDNSDGRGQYIAIWNRPEAKPTQEQLDEFI